MEFPKCDVSKEEVNGYCKAADIPYDKYNELLCERDVLKEVVITQAKEILALKQEIKHLKER